MEICSAYHCFTFLDEQLYSTQIGGGDWFWVKTTYDSQDDTFSVIGADGALVALDDVIQDNNHLLEKVIGDTGGRFNRHFGPGSVSCPSHTCLNL